MRKNRTTFNEFLIDGKLYAVEFVSEWHNPPLDAKYKPARIKQTTTCTLKQAVGPMDGGFKTIATGVVQCSVKDRFNALYGEREALTNAVRTML